MEKKKNKLTKRKIQAINTKKNIYNAAISLMEKHGFDGTTIEEISQKAGVSVGAFYHYFNSKYDILIEAFDRIDDYFETNISGKLKHKSSLKNIEKFFRYYAKYNVDTGLEMIKVIYNSKNMNFIRKGRFLQSLLTSIIIKGQQNDEIIDDMSPDEIIEFLFIIARGTAFHWCISNAGFNLQEKMLTNIKRVFPILKKEKN